MTLAAVPTLLGLVLALATAPAWAGDPGAAAPAARDTDLTGLSLDELMRVEVVYAASRYEQKLAEAPAAVTIVTAEEIRKHGYRTLADVLASTRGIFITYDRLYQYAGVRGFGRLGDYNTRLLLLVNGHRINDNAYGYAGIGTDFALDLDLVERVEVVRGPSSSIYGTSAFFGVVNVVTRTARDLKGWSFQGGSASYGTRAGSLGYGGETTAGLRVVASGLVVDSDGQDFYFPEFDTPATNSGRTVGNDTDEGNKLFAQLAWRGLTLEAVHSVRTKRVPTASYGTLFNDRRSATRDERQFLALRVDREPAEGVGIAARVSYDRSDYDGVYVYDAGSPGSPDIAVDNDYGRGRWWTAELQLSRRLLERHRVLVGSEYRYDSRDDQGTYDATTVYLDDHRTARVWAIYLQDELALAPVLRLNAGARLDHYPAFGGTINPRLALIYNPVPNSAVKLLYGRAFRAPNVFELYFSGLGLKAALDLKPEVTRTCELVVEHELTAGLSATASGFYYDIAQLISQQTDPADGLLVFRNVEQARASGVELELKARSKAGATGDLSYTYQHSENGQDHGPTLNSPDHLARLGATWPLLDRRLSLGSGLQCTSRRRTLAGAWARGFVLGNLTLLAPLRANQLEASLGVYNVFDTRYADPGGEEHVQDLIPQDGRSWRARLRWRI
ncbi:MAG: TonB-dependent receptor [Candidatus Eisenbacteria bacterium]|nr:TonB-dependent receptor [Candidatus Eisenbacteria bacterium]